MGYRKLKYLMLAIGLVAITNANDIKPVQCTSCDLQQGRLETIGGVIAATAHFEARQDYAIPIAGFVVISSIRHIQSVADFNDEEKQDYIEFLCKIRTLMRDKLNIKTVYLIQEEDASHFHVWLFPRYEWMDKFGSKIKSVKPIMLWAKEHLNTPENIAAVKKAVESLKQEII